MRVRVYNPLHLNASEAPKGHYIQRPDLLNEEQPYGAVRPPAFDALEEGSARLRIGILEDDANQANLIAATLRDAGHVCVTFPTGKALIARLRQETFDLLLLDWNLPDLSALEVMKWMGTALEKRPPVLIITARSSQADVVAGLDAGADDFIIKPLDPPVLVARVTAVLRRVYPLDGQSRIETFGPFTFDPLSESVHVGVERVQLTSKEFELALVLFRNLHRPLSRAYLLESVWGRNPDLPTRTLDAHVSRLRLKLNLRPERGYRLAPVYSYGYRLESLDSPPPPMS
jgi:DNA-binding response OmpR family regulator